MSIVLWIVLIILRFAQTLGIWWFMLSLFRRRFSDYKTWIIGSSILISLLLTANNIFVHITDNFLIFMLEWPFYVVFHLFFIKKGWGMAIIEATIGYFLYRITETEIALFFNWADIFSIQDAITKVEPAILIQFILPSIVVFSIQMVLAKKNIGYYFVSNRITPSKWGWAFWSINSIIIMIIFGRIIHELESFKRGFYGLDEQPFLWFFISLNLLVLWWINQSGWENRYVKQSISSSCRKKSCPLGLKKLENIHEVRRNVR